MAVGRPLLPPRHLLVLSIAITLGLVTALVWLGWQLVRQDRDLAAQRVRERLESASGQVAAAIDRRLADVDAALSRIVSLEPSERSAALAAWGDSLAPGAVLVEVGEHGVRAFPSGRLLFVPVAEPGSSMTETAFTAGERREFQERDFAGAARAYRELTGSPDDRVRAGALLRLGRTLRKADSHPEALEAFARLARFDSLEVAGLPAGMVARHARITVLDQDGHAAAARDEARALLVDIMAGRWRLSHGSFEFYHTDLVRLSEDSATGGGGRALDPGRLALSRAVDSLLQESRREGHLEGAQRQVIDADDTPVLVLSSAQPGRSLAMLSAPGDVTSSLGSALAPLLEREGMWLALTTPSGSPVLRFPDGVTPGIVRSSMDTRLPWTLALAGRNPERLAEDLAARHRMLLAGLAVAALLGLVATYAVARAVGRELDVARVQSDFVSAVSHEFRTPLTSLRQLTELLASDRVPTAERRHHYYDVLRRESLRLHRLVEGLLDFARMEAGAREFRLAPLDAAGLLGEVVREFQAESTGSTRPVDLQCPDGRCMVRADREALGRAVWNLLENAVKYSSADAPVTVTVARTNGRVAIRVRDQGPGIPPGEQRAVFEKFVRGRAARESGVRGTGLGLAMVRQIARGHRGDIRLDSIVGRGSTFTLTLPAEEDA